MAIRFNKIEDRIETLKYAVKNIKPEKVYTKMRKKFLALHKSDLYKSYMDEETQTHENFLKFFLLLKRHLKNRGIKPCTEQDLLDLAGEMGIREMNRGMITFYILFKTYNFYYPVLQDLNFPMRKVHCKIFKEDIIDPNIRAELDEAVKEFKKRNDKVVDKNVEKEIKDFDPFVVRKNITKKKRRVKY